MFLRCRSASIAQPLQKLRSDPVLTPPTIQLALTEANEGNEEMVSGVPVGKPPSPVWAPGPSVIGRVCPLVGISLIF